MNSTQAEKVAQESVPAINQWLPELLKYLQNSEVSVADKAPLLLQEILQYGTVYYTVMIVVWGIFFLGFFRKAQECIINSQKHHTYEDLVGFYIIGVALACSLLVNSILGLFEIIIAPRLYIIEQLSNLIK